MTPISEARARANRKYDMKAYDMLSLKVKKGGKEKLKEAANTCGVSVGEYIRQAINARLEKEGYETL